MTLMIDSADASFYYREDATADVARMDSSAVYGNLADAMKNATVLLPLPQIVQISVVRPPRDGLDVQRDSNVGAGR